MEARRGITFAVVGILILVGAAVPMYFWYESITPPPVISGSPTWTCKSPDFKVSVAAWDKKGLAIDDTTMISCPARVPSKWPNSDTPVSSVRLFTAWGSKKANWPDGRKNQAWQKLKKFAELNNVKFLVGSAISCNEDDDQEDWENVKALLKILGRNHTMGVAIGNELELLHLKDEKIVPKTCIEKVWGTLPDQQYFVKTFDRRVSELNLIPGFDSVPLTSVFGGGIFANWPFENSPEAKVQDFFKHVTGKYKERYVYSLNSYPYFAQPHLDAGSTDQCTESLNKALCWNNAATCGVPGDVKTMRDRMTQISPANKILWVTETGWSSPASKTLSGEILNCAAFTSLATFEQYYKGFLSWDMQISGALPPDHIFYFTARDADNFGLKEHFGIIADCETDNCKFQSPSVPDPSPGPAPSPVPPVPPAPAPIPPSPVPPLPPVPPAPAPIPPSPVPPVPPVPPAPAPIPAPPGPSPGPKPPPPTSAACSAHPACKRSEGNCCPTDSGDRLACCGTVGSNSSSESIISVI